MHNWHLKRGVAYLTSGVGYGREKLPAFDAAELDANIIAGNAVQVSSFIPPGWKILRDKGTLKSLTGHGIFLPMASAYSVSNDSPVATSLAIRVNRIRNRLPSHGACRICDDSGHFAADIGN